MEELPVIDEEEFYVLRRELENVHCIFYQLWEMGKPTRSDQISTAAVKFGDDGESIDFLINPYFWSHLDKYNKRFVLCHEMLHVYLNHGIRMSGGKYGDEQNKAADIVVNEMLVKEFGFNRDYIAGWKDYCWADTVLDGSVPKNKSYEYYFDLLKQRKNQSGVGGEKQSGKGDGGSAKCGEYLVDDHDWLNESLSKEIVERIKEEIDPEELSDIGKLLQKIVEHRPGTSPGNWWDVYKPDKEEKKKKKWETVIHKWARTQIKIADKEEDQWVRVNRRFLNIAGDLILPTEMEVEAFEEEENKIKVWFFQDTSGSCHGYWKRFFKAARSLPDDKFDVEMHCFDTRIYKTTLESGKVYGGGGTYFHIMEEHIQKEIKHDLKSYPKAVFVITDGCAGSFLCAFPERWYWFLTPNGKKSSIPEGSNIYDLKDFE